MTKESRLAKMKSLEKALKEEHEKSSEHLNRLMYLQADFENYRKRMEKNRRAAAQQNKEKLIVSFLNVVDELELALRAGRKTQNKAALLKGVEMTLKKMYMILKHEGVARIEADGKSFNPEMHEVLLRVPTKEHDENMVIEEIRRGYLLGDKVIRPSMVKIATRAGVKADE